MAEQLCLLAKRWHLTNLLEHFSPKKKSKFQPDIFLRVGIMKTTCSPKKPFTLSQMTFWLRRNMNQKHIHWNLTQTLIHIWAFQLKDLTITSTKRSLKLILKDIMAMMSLLARLQKLSHLVNNLVHFQHLKPIAMNREQTKKPIFLLVGLTQKSSQ